MSLVNYPALLFVVVSNSYKWYTFVMQKYMFSQDRKQKVGLGYKLTTLTNKN